MFSSAVIPELSLLRLPLFRLPSPGLSLHWRPMSNRTAHLCLSSLGKGASRPSADAVRLIELQGPACGRFTR
jgi:hypothetical protein